MRQELIFAPMGVLALLTVSVLGLVPIYRVLAVSRRKIATSDFKHGESAAVPGWTSIPNRAYMNLLEFPVLFYVVCLATYAVHGVERPTLLLAWTFVALRLAHTLLHVTFNVVGLRAIIFGVATVPVVALWMRLLAHVFPGGVTSMFDF